MVRFLLRSVAFAVTAVSVACVSAQTKLYEEKVSDSDHLRAEQAKELDEYIRYLNKDKTGLGRFFQPNFSSVGSYLKSTNSLRSGYASSIGYPPPGDLTGERPEFTKLGEDDLGVYYRVKIPVAATVHSEGIYIIPKNRKGRVPLVVSMHGGGGSPEVALFHGGANYHDMVRGGVKRGYAVFAPQHLFSAPGFPGDIRNKIDDRLRLVGTSITAIEVAKITRALDVLLRRPEIDARRVAMVGLSYGGYYALVTPALDQRIKVSVSSCYFGVQEYRYERDELSVPSDFRSFSRFTLYRDSEIAALVCPRALMIQAGKDDDGPHRDMGIRLAPEVAEYYSKLSLGDRFKFELFNGGHEFDDASAWEFVKKHL